MRRKKRKGLLWLFVIPVLLIGFGIGVFWGRQPDAPQEVGHTNYTSLETYAYSTLNDQEKQVYDQMVYAIENREEYVSLATTDQDEMQKVYWAVRYDHCEYFWTDSYRYEVFTNRNGEVTALYFRPQYTMDEEEQEKYQKEIEAAAAEMLSGISQDATDYEKALYVYTTLIRETEYSEEAPNNQNIISTFLNHQTVCQGYSYGAQYLLNILGVPCTTICGTADGVNHSWNLIRMDGDYYYMDVTWGETEYWTAMDEESEMQVQDDVINYSYFGVSDEDTNFMQRHQAFDYVPLPECSATRDNYFVHEGLYFDQWDSEAVGSAIRHAYERGESAVFLKFSDESLYARAFTYLIEENNWSRYCDLNQISYIDGFDTNVLMLRFD